MIAKNNSISLHWRTHVNSSKQIQTCKSLAASLRPSSFSTLCCAAIPLCKPAMLNKTHTFS